MDAELDRVCNEKIKVFLTWEEKSEYFTDNWMYGIDGMRKDVYQIYPVIMLKKLFWFIREGYLLTIRPDTAQAGDIDR
jgi:hypothetical protein